ncbi:MAG: hypothetical protein M1818_004347 [Claussenomyces sp. TS43310]|nr:MAG: hypothetical protein M1818_004347 [Claussenomyces sp. TS43310]
MSGRLAGKTAVVTGASKGIGRACALALGREGANVVVNYLSSRAQADEVVATIGAERALAVGADVADLGGIQRLVAAAVERFGQIDILVLNAGKLLQRGGLDDVDEPAFDHLYRANVKGPFFTVKEAAKHMPPGARVLFFSTSITAWSSVSPNYLLYASTKGAVEQMTRVLAKDLGARGITVNTISPGPTATDSFYVGKDEALLSTIAASNPARRIGTPEDIANAVVFVAGPESAWMNGQNFRVNGGMTVG